MKKFALAAAFSVVASASFAGGVAGMDPELVVKETTSSSAGGVVVPLLALLVIAAVASN